MYVHQSRTDEVLTIRIERPERRNALDGAGWAAIAQAIGASNESAEARVVVIQSVGPTFCGGADLSWLRAAPEAELASIGSALEAIQRCPRPVVCRVQGPAYGGGIGLIAAADLVVASPLARFTLSEVRLGIAPALISPYLIARVGPARFRAWALLGQAVSPIEAEAAGLVDLLTTEDGLDAAVSTVIADLRRGEPGALDAIKRIPSTGLATEAAASLLRALRERPAFAEGIAALKEGRTPIWMKEAGA